MDKLEELRNAAREIFGEALAAVDARRAVLDAVEFDGATLRVGDARLELRGDTPKVYSVALGKAAAAMASALGERLGQTLAGGVLSAPRSGHGLSVRWRVYEGGHPLPNAESLEAARAAFELLREADEAGAPVVFLVSGGGSAMLELPRDERLTLEDLREANRVLVSCGAPIDEVNAVRRALSAVKGGGLAARAPRAAQATLVISDVAAGRAYDVASGPTLEAPHDSPDVAEIVARYGLTSKLPAPVLLALEEAGAHGHTPPRPAAQRTFHVLLDNASACEAAVRAARARGFAVEFAREIVEQHVEEGAAELVSRLLSLHAREGGRGVCLISGGEFSCPVRGGGTGGRNSETALRVAFELEKVLAERGAGLAPAHAVALCAGTDGIDGNSPAAGALADETTITRSHAQGLDAPKFLDGSDAYTLFDRLGDAVVTGPTGTNVRDVRILLAAPNGLKGPARSHSTAMRTQPNTPEPSFTHDIFISYSRVNREFAARLEKALEGYKPPPGLNDARQRYLNVFRDETDFTGVEYHRSIEEHLKKSEKLVVVCSPDARRSRFVNEEIRIFADVRGAEHIIPVLVSGVPNNEAKSDDDEERAFPAELSRVMEMPLAADYREFDARRSRVNGGLFYGAWCKLLADFYGATRDEIEQRERKRQRRRRLTVTAIVGGVISLLSVALIFALLSRREAERQRGLAVERERSARRLLYVSNMSLAQRAYRDRDYARMNELLAAQLPSEPPAAAEDEVRRFDWYHLWHLGHDETGTLHGHTDSPTDVGFSPDGGTLATAGLDGTIRLWDAGSRREVATLETGVNSPNRMAFSPDGELLAVGGSYGALELWEVVTRRRLAKFGERAGYVMLTAFAPDGATLLTGTSDQVVRVWDTATHRKLAEFRAHSLGFGGQRSMALSPDAKLFATGGDYGKVVLWDVTTGKEVGTLGGRAGTFSSADGSFSWLSFSPDGKLLAGSNSSGVVKLWDVQTRRETATLKGQGSAYQASSFSPDGRVLAVITNNGTVELWDVSAGQMLSELKGHAVSVGAVAFSPDGRSLATTGGDLTVKLWDISKRPAQTILRGGDSPGTFSAMKFSPKGKALAAASWDGTIRFWYLETGQTDVLHDEDRGSIMVIDFSPRGDVIAAGTNHGVVRLIGVGERRERASVRSHAEDIEGVAFSPDGRTVAVAGQNGEVDLWDTAAGSPPRILLEGKRHDFGPMAVAFSPDGKALAVGMIDGTVKLFDAGTGRELRELKGRRGTVNTLAFSPDGKLLAAGTYGQVALWDAGTWQELPTLKEHKGAISSLAFSPDGRVLATGSSDRTAKLWDLTVWRELATFEGHEESVSSVSFSPDGKLLATSSHDGTVRLWVAASDEAVTTQK